MLDCFYDVVDTWKWSVVLRGTGLNESIKINLYEQVRLPQVSDKTQLSRQPSVPTYFF